MEEHGQNVGSRDAREGGDNVNIFFLLLCIDIQNTMRRASVSRGGTRGKIKRKKEKMKEEVLELSNSKVLFCPMR